MTSLSQGRRESRTWSRHTFIRSEKSCSSEQTMGRNWRSSFFLHSMIRLFKRLAWRIWAELQGWKIFSGLESDGQEAHRGGGGGFHHVRELLFQMLGWFQRNREQNSRIIISCTSETHRVWIHFYYFISRGKFLKSSQECSSEAQRSPRWTRWRGTVLITPLQTVATHVSLKRLKWQSWEKNMLTVKCWLPLC